MNIPVHNLMLMRTTLNLSDEAYGKALAFARGQHISVSEAVNRLLVQSAFNPPKARKKKSKTPSKSKRVHRLRIRDPREIEDDW